MNRKTFFPFFLILVFIVLFILGCTSFGGQGDLTTQSSSAKFSKGIFNTSILVNGASKTELSLTSKQPAEIGITLKNEGPNDINNIKIRAIGCVENVAPSNGIVDKDSLTKGATDYFSWTVRAPEMGSSESFSCPLILRACFEETSSGYMELVVVNETYSVAPSTPNFFYQSGIFTTEPNFGVFRIINDKEPDVLYGSFKINNKGFGWIDYLNQTQESDLEINKIKRISMSIDPASDLQFYKVGELQKTSVTPAKTIGEPSSKHSTFSQTIIDGIYATGYWGEHYCIPSGEVSETGDKVFYCWTQYTKCDPVISSDGKKLTIESGCTNVMGSNYDYFLKMIGGQELNIYLGLYTPEQPKQAESYDMINYNIESGYCVDLASINVKLSGH